MTIGNSHETHSLDTANEVVIGEKITSQDIQAPFIPLSTDDLTADTTASTVTTSTIAIETTVIGSAALEASDNSNGSLIRDAWRECVEALQGSLDSHVFTAYILPLEADLIKSSENDLVLLCPNSFLRSYVDRYLRDKIEECFSLCLARNAGRSPSSSEKIRLLLNLSEAERKVKDSPFIVVKKIPTAASARVDDSASNSFFTSTDSSAESRKPLSVGLNPRYTFANFVVGNSNQFCHAAALRSAENPGRSYNPLFVYGGVGLGKTHLLHAIGNFYLERNPNGRVVYMSSETFTNELILALRHAKMEEFKSKMRNIEVLLIDDIQFMRGKERTQEEFFHTFNALYNAKHQIVITSDKIPSDIPGLEERLQTRFSWGLTADIQAPDFETRVAILKRKAGLDNFELPENVAHLIAENISSNIRELEGALTRIGAMSSLQGVPLTEELAQAALKPLLQPRNVNFSIDDIKKAVALHFGIKTSEMVSKRRTKNLSFPRHVAMYLCRKHTTASYPEIGAEFGGRDHSSVIHAANVVAGKIKKDQELAKIVEGIEKKLVTR